MDETQERILRIYCDTSVFGGCFDEEFREASTALLRLFREKEFILVYSDATLAELRNAPERVRDILIEMPEGFSEYVEPHPVIDQLREAYLKEGILGPSSAVDAWHIASATVGGADMIVSWNFKHIVHYEKIQGFHGVNVLHGFPAIPIYSPLEVI